MLRHDNSPACSIGGGGGGEGKRQENIPYELTLYSGYRLIGLVGFDVKEFGITISLH